MGEKGRSLVHRRRSRSPPELEAGYLMLRFSPGILFFGAPSRVPAKRAAASRALRMTADVMTA